MYREVKEQPKKTIKVKNNTVTAKDKRPLLSFYLTGFEQVFVDRLICFIFNMTKLLFRVDEL